MPEKVRRGFVQKDEMEFHGNSLYKLKEAQRDIVYLINRGYKIKRSVDFTGDRFQFSSRQRTALTRATCCRAKLLSRQKRMQNHGLEGKTLTVDGFNAIITLEAALSCSTVILCMDGTLRDLCGLRGTYRIIDKTDTALKIMSCELERLQIGKAVFILDRPVSNSGRLRRRIIEDMSGCRFQTEVFLADKADMLVAEAKYAATSDSAILDRCGKWVNITKLVLNDNIPEFKPVDLSFTDRQK